jgi:toxin-antitoxin system PIN domain toxin
MMLPDVNIIIQAFHADAADHARCSRWLDSLVSSGEPFGISPQVLSSAIRILTNRRSLRDPYTATEVLEFCNRLLDQPNCQVIAPGPRHWQIFCDLCQQSNAAGDLIPDAWFAALAIEHACEWVTLDRDFARFPRLRWSTPF